MWDCLICPELEGDPSLVLFRRLSGNLSPESIALLVGLFLLDGSDK